MASRARTRTLAVLAGALAVAAGVWALSPRRGSSDGARADSAAKAAAKEPAATPPPLAEPGLRADRAASVHAAPAPAPVGFRATLDGTPAAGVRVRLLREEGLAVVAEDRTDAKGGVRFPSVPRGLVVEAVLEGARVERRFVADLDAEADGLLALPLVRAVLVVGRVVAEETGAPIAGASVVDQSTWGGGEVGPTDAEGRFRLPGAEDESTVTLEIRARERLPLVVGVPIRAGKPEPADVVVRLARACLIRGRVVSESGSPVAGARVEATRFIPLFELPEQTDSAPPPGWEGVVGDSAEERDEIANLEVRAFRSPGGAQPSPGLLASSAEDGTFEVDGAEPEGSYRVQASAPRHAPSLRVRVDVPQAGQPERATLRLRAAAVVRLLVTVRSGASAPEDLEVRLFHGDEDVFPPDDREADGRFRFDRVAPGGVTLLARGSNFRSAARRLVVVGGGVHEVWIAPDPGATVDGVVVDAEGRPLADAEVSIAPVRESEGGLPTRYLLGGRQLRTDRNGRFRARALVAGRTWLLASWRDDEGTFLASRRVVAFDAPAEDLRVVLRTLGGVRVRLKAPDGEAFVGEVDESILRPDGSSSRGTSTGFDGSLAREYLHDGEYEWTLCAPGFAWEKRTFRVADGATVDLGDVRLDPGAPARGLVVDLEGRPMAGVRVAVTDTHAMEPRTTTTGADGRFAIEHCPPGPIGLQLSAEGLPDAWAEADAASGSRVEVRMGPPTTVQVSVRRPAGADAGPLLFELRRPGSSRRNPAAFRGGEGSEAFTVGPSDSGACECVLPSGRWLVVWEDPQGLEHRLAEWDLVGKPREETLTLPAAASR